jgi:hypothetical protein
MDVLDVVKEGYKLPFKDGTLPPPSSLPNNKSSLEHPEFVEEQLFLFEASGAIISTKIKPHIILPLSVVYSNKWRLVIDASRNLNPYLVDHKVKLSHLEVANENLKVGDWMATLDLESGYHQVPMHPDHYTYLGIEWKKNGKSGYWVWRVLFLGVKSAVHIFTKILKPHIAYCQKLGILLSIFIDDLRTIADSYKKCKLAHRFSKILLALGGWIVKPGKGIDDPTQFGTFLGLDHCLLELKYYIPEKKMENILEVLLSLSRQRRVKLRFLASVYGKIAACRQALGQVATLLTRHGHNLIAVGSEFHSWEGYVTITAEVLDEVLRLRSSLRRLNGWSIHEAVGIITPHRAYATDASAIGMAGAEILCGHTSTEHFPHPGACTSAPIVSRWFSESECEESSTLRELVAVRELVISQAFEWSCERILILCDNFNVSVILRKGSRKIHLHAIAIELHLICHQMQISLSSMWVTRDDPRISQADAMSRYLDFHDWGTTEEAYKALCLCMPEVEVDLFGSDTNAKCKKFFSEAQSPLSGVVDAFSFDWSKHGYGYACPPVRLIGRAIKHIILCKSVGTLAIPLWAASSHWTVICPDGVHFSSLFTRALVGRPEMQSGIHVRRKMFQGYMQSDFVYLEYDGKIEQPFFPVLRVDMCTKKGCNKCF